MYHNHHVIIRLHFSIIYYVLCCISAIYRSLSKFAEFLGSNKTAARTHLGSTHFQPSSTCSAGAVATYLRWAVPPMLKRQGWVDFLVRLMPMADRRTSTVHANCCCCCLPGGDWGDSGWVVRNGLLVTMVWGQPRAGPRWGLTGLGTELWLRKELQNARNRCLYRDLRRGGNLWWRLCFELFHPLEFDIHHQSSA